MPWGSERSGAPVGQSPQAIAPRASQPKQAVTPGGEAAPIEAADESRHFDREKQDALWREDCQGTVYFSTDKRAPGVRMLVCLWIGKPVCSAYKLWKRNAPERCV